MTKETSIFRYQFWIQRGMSEADAKLKVSAIQKNNAKKRFAKFSLEQSYLHKSYWINRKGYSEDAAIKKIAEIQSGYSAKSSKFAGKIRTEEGKRKISESVKRHIATVGAIEWVSHVGVFNNGRSKIEAEFYNYIKQNINPNVEANVIVKNFIVDVVDNNKIIEFYGDYWHANPTKYKTESIISFGRGESKTAQEIWDKDHNRLEILKKEGYDVLIIWEHEWRTEKLNCVEKIKKYYEQKINKTGDREN
jgi:hypothetical protein